jgi:hypothetical protein
MLETQPSYRKRSTLVGGRRTLAQPYHWRDEMTADTKRSERRWIRRTEKQALRTGRYEF